VMLSQPVVRRRPTPWRSRSTRGFSQIEVAASTALMSVLMIATMASIAASRKRTTDEMNRLQGQLLATELLSEILSLPACDPQSVPPATPGRESGETNGNIRTNWDDVDDYHNLTHKPIGYRHTRLLIMDPFHGHRASEKQRLDTDECDLCVFLQDHRVALS